MHHQPAKTAVGSMKRSTAVAGFVSLTALVLPFVAILRHNRDHFQVPLSEHLGPLIALAAGAFAALLAGQLILGRSRRRAAALVLFAVGTILWMNSVVLIGDFGYLDGSAIDWTSYRYQVAAEFIVVATTSVLLIRYRQWAYDNLLFLSGLLTLLAFGPALVPGASSSRGDRDYVFTDQGVMDLSRTRNAFLIVLDTMQSDVFSNVLQDKPEWKKDLAGFTYFRNAVSSFPKTYASVPAMLTGKAFANEQPIQDYLQSAYFTGSLPQVLMRNGYDVRMLPYRVQPLIADPMLVSNVASTSNAMAVQPTAFTELLQIYDLVLFRLAPMPVKPWLYNDGEFRLAGLRTRQDEASCDVVARHSTGNNHHDLEFLDRFVSCAKRTYDAPAFRFYHLSGAHQPFVLDAELNHLDPAPRNRKSFIAHSAGAIAVLRRFLQHLRDLGVYEESLIVVVGDHGGGELGVGVDPAAGENIAIVGDYRIELSPHVATGDLIAGAIPLILVKRPGAGQPMETSDAPVQLTDIPATVLAELGLSSGDVSGQSMFQIPEGEIRPRLHRYYRFAGWDVDYILPLVEFRIEGHSWDPSSWTRTGTDLNPGTGSSSGSNYATLFEGGNPDRYLAAGWREPTVDGTRMAAPAATIHLAGGFEETGPPLRLTVVHQPLRSGRFEEIDLEVVVNDQIVDTLTILPGARRVEGMVPRPAAGTRGLELTFRTNEPDAASELVFHQVELQPLSVPAYELGSVVDFRRGGNSEPYQVAGFSHPESWGTWSHGDRSILLLHVGQIREDLQVSLEAAGLVTPDHPSQRVVVLANGTMVAEMVLSVREFQQVDFRIPRRALDEPHLHLEFRFPDATSPYKLGRSSDKRRLAMGFIRMRVSRAASR